MDRKQKSVVLNKTFISKLSLDK